MHLSSAIGALLLSAGLAQAQGCPPAGGETIAEIEAMNQMVVDSKFVELGVTAGEYLGMDFGNGFVPLSAMFAEGFSGCTTVLQRRDTGGLMQMMVVYHGAIGPLFGYWMSMTGPEGFKLIFFELNTDASVVTSYLK